MADPKRPTLRLVEIPDDYQAPSNARPEELQKAAYARAIKEGRARERKDHDLRLEGVKLAHVDELNRSGKIVAKAAHRDGVLHGIVMGGAMIAATIGLTWVVVTQVVMLNTATQRVNYPNPPTLQEPLQNEHYQRVNPREPGNN